MQTQTENAVTTNATTEADNILSAVQEAPGPDKLLKFKKSDYFINDECVSPGAEYLAHCVGWTKAWLKFVDGKVADRKLYRVARGEKPPEREELNDLDLINSKDADGKSNDPWVFQYLLPFENMESGELVIFTTASIGGQQAVRELCDGYAKRIKKGQRGQPMIQLAVGEMKTKNFGSVPRPKFEIVGWDDSGDLTAAPVEHTGKPKLDDEIPF